MCKALFSLTINLALLAICFGSDVAAQEVSKKPSAVKDASAHRAAAVAKITELGGRLSDVPENPAGAIYEVDFSDTKISNDDLVHLRDLGRVLELNFKKTEISDAGLKHIMPLRGLRAIRLEGSRVTVAGIREFWRVHPQVDCPGIGGRPEGDPEKAKQLLRPFGDAILDQVAAERAAMPRSKLAQRVFAALKRRDDAVRSFRFSWRQRDTQHKGSRRPGIGERGELPLELLEKDLSYSGVQELAVDGHKIRYQDSSERPTTDDKDQLVFRPFGILTGYDGLKNRTLSFNPKTSQFERLSTQFSGRSWAVGLAYGEPLFQTYCTFDAVMVNGDWYLYDVTELTDELTGRKFPVLQRKYTDPYKPNQISAIHSWWLDPEKDYAIVRQTSASAEGLIRMRYEINHKQDPQHGWTPSLWRYRRFDADGNVTTSFISTVTKYEINPQFDNEFFVITESSLDAEP